MKLELASFEKAIEQLKTSLDYSTSESAKKDLKLFMQFRNSVIQCFEFTYELSWKMLKRFLEKTSPTPDLVDQFSFNDLFRVGAEQGLVSTPKAWFDFRKMRNVASHTYEDKVAQEVYEAAPLLLKEATYLFQQLSIRND